MCCLVNNLILCHHLGDHLMINYPGGFVLGFSGQKIGAYTETILCTCHHCCSCADQLVLTFPLLEDLEAIQLMGLHCLS